MEQCWPLSGLLAHCQAGGTTLDVFWPRVLKGWILKVHGGRRQGVSKFWVGLWEGTCSNWDRGWFGWSGADLLKCRGWADGVSKLGSEYWQHHSGSYRWHVYAGGPGRKWHPPAPLFLKKFPNNLCSFSTHSEFSRQLTLLDIPGTLQAAASMLYLHGAVYCALFKGRDSISSCLFGSLRAELTVLKFQVLSPTGYKNS